MGFSEKMITLLKENPGLTDREITDVLKGKNVHPSQVNSESRLLAQKGFLTRAKRPDGRIGNFLTGADIPIIECGPSALPATTSKEDWFWEGNVQKVLVGHLQDKGWRLVSTSDTASKERGVDIHAAKEDQVLLIEVKGYPSKGYSDPKRAHEKKKTSSTLQAGHWYSHAVLKAMRLQAEYPKAKIVIGLPDFPRYRSLFNETKVSLNKLDFEVWGVDESGLIMIW